MEKLFSLRFKVISGADARDANPFAGDGSDRVIISIDTLASPRVFGRLKESSIIPYDLAVFDDLLVKTGGEGATEAYEDKGDEDKKPAEGPGSGGKVKLKPWNQRRSRSLGYEAPGGRPVPLVDRIHRLMHLWRAGDVHKVDAYFDEHGLRRHELFRRVLQSMIELAKAGSEERSLLESFSNHIGAKGARKSERQPAFQNMVHEVEGE